MPSAAARLGSSPRFLCHLSYDSSACPRHRLPTPFRRRVIAPDCEGALEAECRTEWDSEPAPSEHRVFQGLFLRETAVKRLGRYSTRRVALDTGAEIAHVMSPGDAVGSVSCSRTGKFRPLVQVGRAECEYPGGAQEDSGQDGGAAEEASAEGDEYYEFYGEDMPVVTGHGGGELKGEGLTGASLTEARLRFSGISWTLSLPQPKRATPGRGVGGSSAVQRPVQSHTATLAQS